MDWNNINEDRDTSGLGPIEYDQSKVPQLIRKHADNVRAKTYGQEVREAQARNAELAGLIASEADSKATNADSLSKETQKRFNDQIAGTTNSDEVIDARRPSGGESFKTLGSRLDSSEKLIESIPVDIQNMRTSNMLNSDFSEMPHVRNETSGFTFEVGDFGFENGNLFKVKNTGAGSFSLILNEYAVKDEYLKLKLVTKTSIDNFKLTVSSFDNSIQETVDLGPKDTWNIHYFSLGILEKTTYDYLKFKFEQGGEIYFKEINVTIEENKNVISNAKTLPDLNKFVSQPEQKFHNSQGAIENIIKVAKTYLDKISTITYGNSKTAIDNITEKVNDKYELDCSSFVGLVLSGVTFKNSKYTTANNVTNPMFFNGINYSKYRYANQIAKFAFDTGYAYIPNKDMSNVEPGDVLFFSWNSSPDSDFKNRAFMNIEHTGFFLNKRNSNTKVIYDLLQYYEGDPSNFYYTAGQQYMDQVVLAARFPLANMDSVVGKDNIISVGNKNRQKINSTSFEKIKLTQPLVKGKYYTIIMKASINAGSYFTFANNAWEVFYNTWDESPSNDGVYIFRTPYLKDLKSDYLNIGVTNQTTTTGASIEWIMMFEGFKSYSNEFLNTGMNYEVSKITLNASLPTQSAALYPTNQVIKQGNIVTLIVNAPFDSWITGNQTVGSIPTEYAPSSNTNVPCMFRTGYDGSPVMFGYLLILTNGQIQLRPISTGIEYKEIIVNASYLL